MRLANCDNDKIYEVEKKVYENDLTKVWCGIVCDWKRNKYFAKILSYGKHTDERVIHALLEVSKQEAVTLKKVAQCTKSVPGLRDSWNDVQNKEFVIIMDLVPGKSLRAWLNARKEQLQAKDVFLRKCIIIELCKIMRDINRRYPAIVHRDLKPENIYICFNSRSKKWDVYIIDFGCANLNHIRNVGTTNYQAPEQIGNKNTRVCINSKTDIFAIGQIFYEMLLGSPPRISVDYLYRAREQAWVQTPVLGDYLLKIPGVDKLEQVLKQMTCLNQDDRPTYERVVANLMNIRIG